MEVVTDAVPSQARCQSPSEAHPRPEKASISGPIHSHGSKSSEDVSTEPNPSLQQSDPLTEMVTLPERKKHHQPTQGGLKSPMLKNEIKGGITNNVSGSTSPTADSSRPSFSTRNGTKQSHSKKSSRSGGLPFINISHSSGIMVGTVYNHYHNRKESQENNETIFEKMSDGKRKQINKLLNSASVVDTVDIIIISEQLDRKGLRKLSKLLGLQEHKINQLEDEYGFKGPKELSFQTLEYWRQSSSGEENQSAMLSRLCYDLVRVWCNGGEQALENLHRKHFEE